MRTETKIQRRFGHISGRIYFIYPFPDDDLHVICVEQKIGWLSGKKQRPILHSPLRYLLGTPTISAYIEGLNLAKQKYLSWEYDMKIEQAFFLSAQ